MALVPTMAAETAAGLAIEAARAGGRALVIRNTVAEAIAIFQAVRGAGAEDLLLDVADGPALHHGFGLGLPVDVGVNARTFETDGDPGVDVLI